MEQSLRRCLASLLPGSLLGLFAALAPVLPARYKTEWRVRVEDWLAWAEVDEDAYQRTMPNASFLDVSGDSYHGLRKAVRKHFLPDV
jgi:hypothetical protein